MAEAEGTKASEELSKEEKLEAARKKVSLAELN